MAEGDVGTGSRASNALTKKLGPLPGWAWVGLAVGGFIVYRKLAGGSSSSSSAAVPAGSTDTSLGATTPGSLDTGGGGGGALPADGGSSGAGFFFDPTPFNDLTDAINSLMQAQSQPQMNSPADFGITATNPRGSTLFNPGSPVPIGTQYTGFAPGAQQTGYDPYGNPVVLGQVIGAGNQALAPEAPGGAYGSATIPTSQALAGIKLTPTPSSPSYTPQEAVHAPTGGGSRVLLA